MEAVNRIPSEGSDHKSPAAFRTIGEVSAELGLPPHVLRFWESKFSQIKPHKRRGGHRYYRPQDVDTLSQIKKLLHEKGFTIKGAQKFLSASRKEDAAKDQPALFPEAQNEKLSSAQSAKLRGIFNELCEIKDLLNQNS